MTNVGAVLQNRKSQTSFDAPDCRPRPTRPSVALAPETGLPVPTSIRGRDQRGIAASVECPSRLLAVGSSQACRAALREGGTLSVTIRNDVAGHELVAVEELRP